MSGGHLPKKLPSANEGHAIGTSIPVPVRANRSAAVLGIAEFRPANQRCIVRLQSGRIRTYIEHMRFGTLAIPPLRGHQPPAPAALPAQPGVAGQLSEIYAATDDWAAAMAFTLTLLSGTKPGAIVAVRSARNSLPALLYGDGLSALGIAPERLLLAHACSRIELLRAGLEAARCQGISAVLLEMWGRCPEWDLTTSRRFTLAAEQSGAAVLILRGDAAEQPSSAHTRWKVTSAPSAALPANAPGLPAIEAELLRRRGGPAGARWRLQWDTHHEAFRETALSGAVVPLSGLRTGPAELSAAIPQAA